MLQQIIKMIVPSELLTETMHMKNNGFRLAAISCTNKNGMEMTYSFDKDYELINLRFVTDTETEIDSVSSIYSYSFLYENEIKELFGVNIRNISLDFGNNLYRIAVETPFNTEKENK